MKKRNKIKFIYQDISPFPVIHRAGPPPSGADGNETPTV